jgi:hypothetical protein
MTKYNGWANYATWRVMLEYFDNFDNSEYGGYVDGYECKEMVLDYIESTVGDRMVADWARSFLELVDWEEIAQALSEDAEIEEEEVA